MPHCVWGWCGLEPLGLTEGASWLWHLDLALVWIFEVKGEHTPCHSPVPLTQRDFPGTSSTIAGVLGLVLLYSSCSFKSRLCFMPKDGGICPQALSTIPPQGSSQLGVKFPFLTMSLSLFLFSFVLLSFVVQKLFSHPQFFSKRKRSIKRCDLLYSREEVNPGSSCTDILDHNASSFFFL